MTNMMHSPLLLMIKRHLQEVCILLRSLLSQKFLNFVFYFHFDKIFDKKLMLIFPYFSGGTGGTPTPGGGTGGGTGFNPAQLHHFMQQQQTFLNHHQVS